MWGSTLVDNCIVNELTELVDNIIVKCKYESQSDVKSSKVYIKY